MVEVVSIIANSLDPEFIKYLIEYDDYDTKQKYGDEEIINHIVKNYSKSTKYDEYIITLIECGFNYKNYIDKNKNTLLMLFIMEKKYHIIDCILKTINNNYSYLYTENSYDKNIFDILFKDNRNYFDKITKIMMENKEYGYLIDLSIKFSLFDMLLEIVKTGYHEKYYHHDDDKIFETLLTFILRNTWITNGEEIALEIIKHCSKEYINCEINYNSGIFAKKKTPLMMAVMYGYYDIFVALINAGAEIMVIVGGQYTIFDFLACNVKENAGKMLDLIVNKINETNGKGECEKQIVTYFKNICLSSKNKTTVNHIIAKYPKIIDTIRETMIYYIAIKGIIDRDMLDILLKNNILIDTIDENGKTPIMVAVNCIHLNDNRVSDNSVFILDFLLERNTFLCKTDNQGNNVLSYFKDINSNSNSNLNSNSNSDSCIKCNKYYSLIEEKMESERCMWYTLPQPIREEILSNIENYEL